MKFHQIYFELFHQFYFTLFNWVYFDEISDKILNSIPKKNSAFVQKQLNVLDDNFLDYLGYWNEKYYRNGFCDGVQLIGGCLEH